MSNNHPISDSEPELNSDDEFLPPGIQSDASIDETPPTSPGLKPTKTSFINDEDDDQSGSRPSSKTPSFHEDKGNVALDEEEGSAAKEGLITSSFLSVPEGSGVPEGGAGGDRVTKRTEKKPRKRRQKKNGEGSESPKRRRKKKSKTEGGDDDEESNGVPKKKIKKKSKNKPANLRRNIKTFLREDQLDAETLTAQREEEERKKRLEEGKRRLEEQRIQKAKEDSEKIQEALATIAAAIPALHANADVPFAESAASLPRTLPPLTEIPVPRTLTLPPTAPASSECIVLDSGSDSEKDTKKQATKENEVITISSDEEDVTLVSDHSEDEADDIEDGSSGMHTNDEANVPDIHGRVLVNVNHPPDEPDIFLPDKISQAIKPHQVGGIRFLYDNLVESLHRFKSSSGFGCILAHSMGLGKTLQCIGFINIFMRHTNAHTVLCIVPINTLQNWLAEFDMWCTEKPLHFNIFVLNDMHKTTASRAKVIAEWHETGGVLLMGYEMYRLLARSKQSTFGRSKKKNSKPGKSSPQVIDIDELEAAQEMDIDMKAALCNPGPDMVVCDEGHRIKNSHAGISQALKNIKTRRRVVLTGYPLQNNLQEYWCMVDFVRPNFLGSRHEFANLFERPISNGQCMDSTPGDVRLMRYRAHVLHSLLAGFVQRRGFNVLFSTLPPKEEHVILVRLTSFQRGLYVRFMQSFKEAGAGGWCSSNPLKAFSVGCKIWNHPDILNDILMERESLADDLDADLDLPEVQAKFSGKQQKGGKKGSGTEDKSPKRGESSGQMGYIDKVQQIISFEWARDIMKSYKQNKLVNGGKMIVLFHILEESIRLGDKILVFSQSLSTLSLIEKFLAKSTIPQPPNPPPLMPREWVRNKTYFRLDGSTAVSEREKMINQFNSPENKTTWLFLLSTKAGCLGINLIGANRVVVMDASWNPCHDAQAVCRVYRYGQAKKCFVYRLVSDQTLEKKIYDRQISKKGMSDRVVDEMNVEMNLTKKEVESLLEFDETDMPYEDFSHLATDMTDTVLQSLVKNHSNCLTKSPFTTESLLWDRKDMKLTRAEKMQAKKGYEEEKKLNLSYSRPSYSAFYPKGVARGIPIPPAAKGISNIKYSTGPAFPYMSSLKQPLQRPVANVRPIQSTPVPRQPASSYEATQRKLRDLKNAGVTLQRIVATTNIMLPGINTSTDSAPLIKAGDAVTFIKTKKGIYLRTPDGKILAVRGQGAGQTSMTLSAVADGVFPESRNETGSSMEGMAGTPMGAGLLGINPMGGGHPGAGSLGGRLGGLARLEERFGSNSQPLPSNLANSQLGQLLASNTLPSQQFNNPSLPAVSSITAALGTSRNNSTLTSASSISAAQGMTRSFSSPAFPFSMSDPVGFSLPGGFQSFAGSTTMSPSMQFSNAPVSTTPYSLGNTSTLTMSTDTAMHSGMTKSSSVPDMAQSFPSTSRLPQSSASLINAFKDASPSPGFSFPSFGDDTWNDSSQGSLDMDQNSAPAPSSVMPQGIDNSAGRITPSSLSGMNPASFAGLQLNPGSTQEVNQKTDSIEGSSYPSSVESIQSVNLASSLPYPQKEAKYFPAYRPSSSTVSTPDSSKASNDDGSNIASLTRFVDSSFPNLMPFSMDPDQDSSNLN